MNLILKKNYLDFSYIRYFLFVYFKRYNLYKKYIKENVFFIPYKKRIKPRYLVTLKEFLQKEKTDKIIALDEDILSYFKKYFSVIYGKNIYNTIFCDALNFLSNGRLFEYEVVFVSDNLKEIKYLIEKCAKNVKAISVLTEKAQLYENLSEFVLYKYGIELNIKTKKEKLKKNKKIYVNCGHTEAFEKNYFKNVNMLDIFNVYEGAYKKIILEANESEKEFTKKVNSAFSHDLAEFLHGKETNKKFKIVSIKK